MKTQVVNIAKDFTPFPIGRYASDGDASGESFRRRILVPLLHQTDDVIEIDLDSASGLGSSFLEEAFGGLIRDADFTEESLKRRIKLISSDKLLVDEIWSYVSDAQKEKSNIR